MSNHVYHFNKLSRWVTHYYGIAYQLPRHLIHALTQWIDLIMTRPHQIKFDPYFHIIEWNI